MWPDPEMLRKLNEDGSITRPRNAPTIEEHNTLKAQVNVLQATLERQNALLLELQKRLNTQTSKSSRIQHID